MPCSKPPAVHGCGAALEGGASQGLGGTSAARKSPSPPAPPARRPEPERRPSPAPAPGHLGTWLGSGFLTQSSPPSRALPTLGGALSTGRPPQGACSRPHCSPAGPPRGGPGWGWQMAARPGLRCISTIPTEGVWPGAQGKAPLAPLASAPTALPHPREGLSRPGRPHLCLQICTCAPIRRAKEGGTACVPPEKGPSPVFPQALPGWGPPGTRALAPPPTCRGRRASVCLRQSSPKFCVSILPWGRLGCLPSGLPPCCQEPRGRAASRELRPPPRALSLCVTRGASREKPRSVRPGAQTLLLRLQAARPPRTQQPLHTAFPVRPRLSSPFSAR